MKQFRIVAKCDPYHARKHYNGQEVLRRDGVTPVEWVIEDGFCSEEETKVALMTLAKTGNPYDRGDWFYEDDASIAQMKKDILEEKKENNEDPDESWDIESEFSWYKGPGIYKNHYPVLLEGGSAFHDDSMTYSVEDYRKK